MKKKENHWEETAREGLGKYRNGKRKERMKEKGRVVKISK